MVKYYDILLYNTKLKSFLQNILYLHQIQPIKIK
jgi:hypothetical protein